MPNIVCPTCATKLEIDDDMIGQDVQCGSCQQIFKAETETKRSSRRGETDEDEKPRKSKYRKDQDGDDDDDDERPSKRRRSKARDDDDDDDIDYEDRRPRRRRGQQGGNGLGIASLVLGIIGILMSCCCGLFGIPLPVAAIITGVMSLKTPGKGMGIAGMIMGGIGLLLVILSLIIGFGNMAMKGGPGGGGGFNQGPFK